MPLLRDTRTAPPGGWHYTQPETGLVMRAASLGELIATVIRHRTYKSIAPLDADEVSVQIQRQICERVGPDFGRPEPAAHGCRE